MTAITLDTNVLTRYLTKDDLFQAEAATQLIENNECEVLPSVLLELVWVLSSKGTYHLTRTQVLERIRHLFTIPTIYINHPEIIVTTLGWYEAGMDFADALHLANSKHGFATFDRHLVNKAKEMNAPQTIIFLGQASH
ncbi:MAG: type II toxin-antitoxin system VapC family toxin [Thiothrix sp.]|jgi:predicted nucleic-acid-binding protein|nr:MAG: type II toxin-antitoxin system VapC family toxin [Thiothrix sp.]